MQSTEGLSKDVPASLDSWELEAFSLLLLPAFDRNAAQDGTESNPAYLPTNDCQKGSSRSCTPACAADLPHSSSAVGSVPARADSRGSLHASCTESPTGRPSSGKTISSGMLAGAFEPDSAIDSTVPLTSCPSGRLKQQTHEQHTAEEREGRYGNKAAYRIRPSKKHRLSASHAAAGLAGARPHELGVTGFNQAKRKRHLTSKTEAAVGDIVAALQRPAHDQGNAPFDRLGAISMLNNLTQLPGNGGAGRADKLRTASVQGMLVNPGWHAVVPSDYAVTQVLLARETGRLDLPMFRLGIEGCQSLGDLVAIPDELSKKLMLEMTSKVVNGMSFRKCAGDAGDQAALRYTGVMCMMSSVVFHMRGDQRFMSKDLRSDSPIDTSTCAYDLTYAKEVLQLDSHQMDMARHVWKQSEARLSSLRAERAELIAQVNLYDAQPEVWRAPTLYTRPRTETLIQQTAALAENALLEQEILRHAARVFAWQICTPAAVARAICHYFPALPNSLDALQSIAAATPVDAC